MRYVVPGLPAFCFPSSLVGNEAKIKGSKLALRASGEISELTSGHSRENRAARTGEFGLFSVLLRWPRKRPSKETAEAPGPSSFETRPAGAPQDDGEKENA